MSKVTKIQPVKAHTIPTFVDAYPIIGGEKEDELLGYKVNGSKMTVAEFEKEYVLVPVPKGKDKKAKDEKKADEPTE